MQEITLANLADKSAQEVFNYVARHLLTQNTKAFREDGTTCAYLSPTGKRCAGGCLMSEEEYHPAFETIGWLNLVKHHHIPSAHDSLITQLQQIHDAEEVARWKPELVMLGRGRGLDVSWLL